MRDDVQEPGPHTFRQLPQALDAEQALLGAILLDNRAFFNVSDFLQSHHFFAPINGLIYMTCESLIRENKQANPLTVRAALDGYDTFDSGGGFPYLASLSNSMTTMGAAASLGRVVFDTWARRELIEAASELLQGAYAPADIDATPQTMVQAHEERLMKIVSRTSDEAGLRPFKDVLQTTHAEWDHQLKGARGVPSGFPDLDKMMGGLHATDLIIIGGRASMGKTSLAVNLAFNAANFFNTTEDLEYKGRQVAFFSMEMSSEQLVSRIITGETGIVSPRNRWGREMLESEWGQVYEMAARYGQLPFWCDDAAAQTMSKMRSRCVRLHKRKPIGLIVIDYLQLISGEGRGQEKRLEEISAITRALKRLAKDLKVPVIALSQLSRAVESREDKRPMMADLRESGTIENDADIVLFPFRAEYYLKLSGPPARKPNETNEAYSVRSSGYQNAMDAAANKCELIIGKQRHGPLGSVELYFDNARTTFRSAEKKPVDDRQVAMSLTEER